MRIYLLVPLFSLILLSCNVKLFDTAWEKYRDEDTFLPESRSGIPENETIIRPEFSERPDTILSMELTSCIEACPEYSISFLDNGEVFLLATANFFLSGYFNTKISPKQLKLIRNKASQFRNTSYASRYPALSINDLSGIPSIILRSSVNNNRAEVYCQYGCPDEIHQLSEYIQSIIPNLDWKEIRL